MCPELFNQDARTFARDKSYCKIMTDRVIVVAVVRFHFLVETAKPVSSNLCAFIFIFVNH